MKENLVSVISPMFNVEKYIDTFIKSIINQTYTNWELILVDDGSTDNTINIVQKYLIKDNRISFYQRTNQKKGANACRNIGMNVAEGEFIIILDSDDIVEPFLISQRVSLIKKNPNIDYLTVKGGSVREDSNGSLIKTDKIYGIDPHRDLAACILSSNLPFGVWNNIYRTTAFLDCRWDEEIKIYQDFDFMLQTALKRKNHMFVENSEIDYWYRMGRPNAITNSFITDEKHKSTIYLFKKVKNLIQKEDNWEAYSKSFKEYHRLQFARLLRQGNTNQRDEFFHLIKSAYSDLRFDILYLLFGKKEKNNARTIAIFDLLLFNPKELAIIAFNRIKKPRR